MKFLKIVLLVHISVLFTSQLHATQVPPVNMSAIINYLLSDSTPALSPMERIKAYADDQSKTAPSVHDYVAIGITGITAENLDLLNAQIALKTSSELDTISIIQELLNDIIDNMVYTITTNTINGVVSNIQFPENTRVILGNDSYLADVNASSGAYSFTNIPDGEYFLKVQTIGQKPPKARKIKIDTSGNAGSADSPSDVNMDFVLNDLNTNDFLYHWEDDASRSGNEYAAHINELPTVEFIDEEIDLVDLAAAIKLKHDYNITLSNEDQVWNEESAHRLLDTIKSLDIEKFDPVNPKPIKVSKWVLTANHIADDIQVVKADRGNTITLSKDVFTFATPKLVMIDGIRGKFFSQRLHHALVNYATDYGKDLDAVEEILNKRFGCTTRIYDYAALTQPTTGEDANSFQAFHPQELVSIINMFEEMPKGYHVVKGLKYLARRKDGMDHPLYPTAPAVAWPTAHEESYIEFMDSAFTADLAHTHRLIIHEKAHFLWANFFSDEIKQDWQTVGGWYENANDPDGWSTTKTTEFVSAYAHGKNPNEDMAESISYYILNPDMLKSRSPSKYEFIQNRIMHGDRYISQIRQDLTFEVLNLYPDYIYPGKIKRVDIIVTGAADEDKTVTVEIELNTANNIFEGAQNAHTRIFSEIGTQKDFYMYPVDTNGTILRGSFTLSKYAKAGYWYTDQIKITDSVGNQRFEGVDDFGWKLYIKNVLEDTIKPRYIKDSLIVQLIDINSTSDVSDMADDPDVDTNASLIDDLNDAVDSGHDLQVINVRYRVDENRIMHDTSPVYATLTNPSSGAYSLEEYGTYNEATGWGNINFLMTEYMASGTYGVPQIISRDMALNEETVYFSNSPDHEPLKTVDINTTNPDMIPPEVDLNRITVEAEPAHPAAPDGETIVKITYYAKDDKSGLGSVNYRLLDPQGISHFEWHYHENFRTLYFNGDPTVWKKYEINIVLPAGSAPGIWGLQELEVQDKANNRKSYNFVETIHFEVEDLAG